ncbi:MAG: nucleoside 2-deoxyribosyltransferase domain-containing protein [Flavobacteriaceae bacterium]|nr:nucleoside 2-deoxyribosyltransferase domain-containing protein [Flavobacteriaceae bacterium]
MDIKVFLSGGMNESNWQQQVINLVGKDGYIYFNPREHFLLKANEYTMWDLFYVKNCDVVFAYMQKDNPSGFGLTLEIGYAAALGKQIILIDEKSSLDEIFEQKFKIVRESSSIVFDNFSDGITYLKNLRNGITTL